MSLELCLVKYSLNKIKSKIQAYHKYLIRRVWLSIIIFKLFALFVWLHSNWNLKWNLGNGTWGSIFELFIIFLFYPNLTYIYV